MTLPELLTKYGIKYPYCGADCGPGWLPIVEKLLVNLIALGWDRDCGQIKEKFGGLRFYIGAGSEAVHDAIQAAEDESFRTCEECGAPGKRRGGGWVKTLCNVHEAERRGAGL